MSGETTPIPSAASEAPAAAADPPQLFTDKDIKNIVAAMQSLKEGPPELDMERFQVNGGFNTKKTAQNTWGTLKKKLERIKPGSPIVTPQKQKKGGDKITPKKRSKKESDDGEGDGDEGALAKKPRTPKAMQTDADGSPKRKTPAKKKSTPKKGAAKSEEKIREEEEDDETPVAAAVAEEEKKTPSSAGPAESEQKIKEEEKEDGEDEETPAAAAVAEEEKKTPSTAGAEGGKMQEATGSDE